MYRGGTLPPKADPKAAEKMKAEAKKRENANAERIASLALGEDPKKAEAAARTAPVVVTEPRSKEEDAADAALDVTDLDESEDE